MKTILALLSLLLLALPARAEEAAELRLVEMPLLVGRDLGDAESVLQSLGLVPLPEPIDDSSRGAWKVAGQDEKAGTELEPGARVAFRVARGRGEIPVPSLVDLSEREARGLLESFGLVAEIARAPSAWPQGRAFGQDPAAGERVAAGSRVTVNVAEPAPEGWRPETIEVPQLVGEKFPQAHLALLAAGLRGDLRFREEPDDRMGWVLAQEPSAGARVLPGSEVIFWAPRQAVVPEVRKHTKEEATRILAEAGFRALLDGPDGLGETSVASTVPTAGRRIAHGATVTVRFVLLAPPAPEFAPTPTPAPVPDPAAGGGWVAPTDPGTPPGGGWAWPVPPTDPTPPDPTRPAPPAGGDAAPTDPSPGGEGLGTVTVPDLVGLTLGEARTRAREAGLGTIRILSRVAGGDDRVVVRQEPVAGSLLLRGSPLGLVLRAPTPEAPREEWVRVPVLIRRTAAEAQRLAEEAGLSLILRGTAVRGTVMSQSPAAGWRVRVGSVVEAVLAESRTPPEGTPPLTPEEELALRGLRGTGSGSGLLGGRLIAPGVLGDALRASQVVVPDLTGKSRDEATRAARAAGLAIAFDSSLPFGMGRVRSQNPPPGSRVARGTVIRVRLTGGLFGR